MGNGDGTERFPKVAYILLWFPKPSETFIFREVVNLWELGLPLKVYTLYGAIKRNLSPEMRHVSNRMVRLGLFSIPAGLRDFLYWLRRDFSSVAYLLRIVPARRWRSLEVAGENLWAFFSGFALARHFEKEDIDHIHAPWANGPATAAWVASRLTGKPFSFTGRAVDIIPPDGALREKMRDAVFVRTNPKVNVAYLRKFACGESQKIHAIYDGYPICNFRDALVQMAPPFKILALGRFARFKGFDVLIHAVSILQKRGVDVRLTLAGSGARGWWFRCLCIQLGVHAKISFPGYITHDRVSDLYCKSDVFVMPSVIHRTGERDGLPNVIIEALLHRLPVVATDVAGIGEVIKSGETGLLVPQRDAHALADAIEGMTRDRSAALKMAERGRQFVLKAFDPVRCHKEVFRLLTEPWLPGMNTGDKR
jgi:glycosyltransferase involved in cell wall biosynthesis